MGSFNCTGYHSRMPIAGGDEIFLILGLHVTPQCRAKYAFEPVEFAPGLNFTPIALPIFCKYDDARRVKDIERDINVDTIETFFGRGIDEILLNCDHRYDETIASQLAETIQDKLGYLPEEYILTYTFDHRFVYDTISSMKIDWDLEKSYELTLEHSDLTPGKECRKVGQIDKLMEDILAGLTGEEERAKLQEMLDCVTSDYDYELEMIFTKENSGRHWTKSVANLNPKHLQTYLYRSCESYNGHQLLSIYRLHADRLFQKNLKDKLIAFWTFYLAHKRYSWMLAIPNYAGQETYYEDRRILYERMLDMLRKSE